MKEAEETGGRTPRNVGPPYLPLGLVAEHLDLLQADSVRRYQALFSTRSVAPETPTEPRRAAASLRGLRMRAPEAIREATTRLHSVQFEEVVTASKVLLMLAPEQCVATTGEILLRTRKPLAVVQALAGVGRRWPIAIGDDVSVEAYSMHSEVPDGVLVGHLWSRAPRAGIVAAMRRRLPSLAAMRRLRRIALGSVSGASTDLRSLALYALGVLDARANGQVDPSFASLVDCVLGDSIFAKPTSEEQSFIGEPMLVAIAVAGHVATARRIQDWIMKHEATPDALYALGLLGIPRHLGIVVDALASSRASVRTEAIRALYLATGQLFTRGGAPAAREDGRPLEPDADAASLFLRAWAHRSSGKRFHLGAPLFDSSPDAAPSARLLRAILIGAPKPLSTMFLPGVFDGRQRCPASFFSIAPPARGIDVSLGRRRPFELPVRP